MDAYLICATPRSGSSLLCGLLASTGVAGRPESYFRAPDEPEWAARWDITRADKSFEYADYLQGALAAGRTDNGVFAARVMWGTMSELVDKLRPILGTPTAADTDVLKGAFGEPCLVRYEDLDRDPIATTRSVLDHLGLALAPDRSIEVRHRRLADDLNQQWIERYRAQR